MYVSHWVLHNNTSSSTRWGVRSNTMIEFAAANEKLD